MLKKKKDPPKPKKLENAQDYIYDDRLFDFVKQIKELSKDEQKINSIAKMLDFLAKNYKK